MSRIGKQPVGIPKGVVVNVAGSRLTVKGPLGELTRDFTSSVEVKTEGEVVVVSRVGESRQSRCIHGLSRSLIANMIEGVLTGYKKELEVQGVGFKAAMKGGKFTLSAGFSSPVEYDIPEGVKVAVKDDTAITVSGMDKEKVGMVAARIRAFYPAEPYKGKGVRYKGEHVRRKVGKTVA